MKGQLTTVDLIISKDVKDYFLKKFIIKLSKIIGVKKPVSTTRKFIKGNLKKYTLIQTAPESTIVIHINLHEKRIFADIFSYKKFDAIKVKQLSQQFFNVNKAVVRTIIRE